MIMYRFPLEPVLHHRSFIEENLQKELAVLKKMLAHEERKLNSYRKAKYEFLCELQKKEEEGITVSEIVLYSSFIERLSMDIAKQRERVLEFEKKVDQKREDLIEAMKKRKILEKLKEKKRKAYLQEVMKKEQGFLNEVAINRFNRRI
jgi:flagellar FliJ protein